MIFVVGYGWSKVLLDVNSELSSSKDTICTCVLTETHMHATSKEVMI